MALTMAVAGALLLLFWATETFGRGSIFCSDTACAVAGVLWSLPSYAAMLGVFVAELLMAATLVRAHVGPPAVRAAALGAAVAGAVGYVVAVVVGVDFAWAGAFSGRLTPPAPGPLLPPILITLAPSLWALSLILIGVSIALTSLLLLALRAPSALVALGWIAGVAIASLVPLASVYAAYTTNAFAAAFLILTAWAVCLAIFVARRSPGTALASTLRESVGEG
jgi:hypothetical protein